MKLTTSQQVHVKTNKFPLMKEATKRLVSKPKLVNGEFNTRNVKRTKEMSQLSSIDCIPTQSTRCKLNCLKKIFTY